MTTWQILETNFWGRGQAFGRNDVTSLPRKNKKMQHSRPAGDKSKAVGHPLFGGGALGNKSTASGRPRQILVLWRQFVFGIGSDYKKTAGGRWR